MRIFDLLGKSYRWIEERIYLYILKMRYFKVAEFSIKQKRLYKGVKIIARKGSKVNIGSIWSGSGTIELIVRSGAEILIGDDVCINSNCKFVAHERIKIGSNTMIGPNVIIYDHDHDYVSPEWHNTYKSAPISVGNNVWIAGNVTILKGVTIGDNAVIGAGVVLNESVGANEIVMQERNLIRKKIVRKAL